MATYMVIWNCGTYSLAILQLQGSKLEFCRTLWMSLHRSIRENMEVLLLETEYNRFRDLFYDSKGKVPCQTIILDRENHGTWQRKLAIVRKRESCKSQLLISLVSNPQKVWSRSPNICRYSHNLVFISGESLLIKWWFRPLQMDTWILLVLL